jgi:HD-GYP domain-containing protein (c-di-GMP phosphodiesterase class II)
MTDKTKQSILEAQKHRNVLGEKYLIAFYRLTSTVNIYQSNNQVLRDCAKEFMDILVQLIAEKGYLTIQISRGQIFLYDEKLIYQRKSINVIREMLDYFEQRTIPGLRFDSSINDASIEQILDFTRLLNNAVKNENPLSWLGQKLDDKDIPWIEIVNISETTQEEYYEELKEIARKTYSYALSSVKETSRNISSQGRSGVRKLKRIVQNMVDFVSDDDSVLLGMSTIREYDDYTYTHSVNVAILSLCLGKRIGLSRIPLSWLGISALLHDLGKLDVPKEILNKPGKLSPSEFQEMEQHPLKSVSQVLKLQAPRDLKAKILLPPLEHHMKYDSSGYPRVRRKQTISLFGRIIGIADVFDALSSPRVYRPIAYSPDKVLSMMLETSGKDFDPILLKVFINMLGVYPVGTLLHLDTGEKGLVVSAGEDENKTRPLIILLVSDNQGGYIKGEAVNLAEQNPGTGKFARNIVSTSHPSTYGIQPAEFIV